MPSHPDFSARAPQRRCPPFFRLPTTSHLLAWLMASTLAAPALAQPAQGSNTPAPLHYTPLTRQSPQAPAEEGWTAANRAVAEFPRGHADIVDWETRTASPAASAAPEATAHASPHSAEQHDMQSIHQKMHPASQGAKPPMHSGHHTKHRGDHHPAPQGGRP